MGKSSKQISSAEKTAIPTEDEISPYNSLDEQWALPHLLGKSLADLEREFTTDDNIAYQYQEDFMWIGDKAFSYYFPAYKSYFESPLSEGDSTLLSAILMTLKRRMEEAPDSVLQIADTMLAMLDYIDGHYDKFANASDEEFFGNMREKCNNLSIAIRRLSPNI